MAVLAAFLGTGCSKSTEDSQSAEDSSVSRESATLETVAEKDFKKAYDAAKKEGKMLMLEFTGSSWCPPCKMLHKFVLNTDEFVEYAKNKMKVVVADFTSGDGPVDKQYAQDYIALAETYQLQGFPTIVLIDPASGETETIVGLQFQSPKELINKIDSVKARGAAKAKASAEKPAASAKTEAPKPDAPAKKEAPKPAAKK